MFIINLFLSFPKRKIKMKVTNGDETETEAGDGDVGEWKINKKREKRQEIKYLRSKSLSKLE